MFYVGEVPCCLPRAMINNFYIDSSASFLVNKALVLVAVKLVSYLFQIIKYKFAKLTDSLWTNCFFGFTFYW